jgi:hypothetical protein
MNTKFYDIGRAYANGATTTDTETAWENWRESQIDHSILPERQSDEWAEDADEFGRGFIDGTEEVNRYLLDAVNVLTTGVGDVDDARETVGLAIWALADSALGEPTPEFFDWVAGGDYPKAMTTWGALKQIEAAAKLWDEMTDAVSD